MAVNLLVNTTGVGVLMKSWSVNKPTWSRWVVEVGGHYALIAMEIMIIMIPLL